MTQRVVCAQGAISALPEILSASGCRHLFLVTGKASYTSCGAEAALADCLAPYAITRFAEFEQNPKLEDLLKGLELFRATAPDLVLAVGGGTVMDMAKMIKIFSAQPKPPAAYIVEGEELNASDLPLVAVPTTAGSGSQATHFSVLYVGKAKFSVGHACMLPDAAIVDPGFLRNIPRRIAASSGLDALNQAIESYWSIHSSEESKRTARKAIELAWRVLRDVVLQPTDDARLALVEAAHLAGEAINVTKTTAPHAISYPITSYFGVAHGHAVGLVLPSMLVYNADVSAEDSLDPRGPAYVRQTIGELAGLLGAAHALGAAQSYDELMACIGLTRELPELGIRTRADLELIVDHGFNPERVRNNPRLLTAPALRAMLYELQDRCRG